MIETPTTISAALELINRHSNAYLFLQGELTVKQSAECCKLISDIEQALSSMSEELKSEMSLRERLGEEF